MKTASIFVHGRLAGRLEELEPGRRYRFVYQIDYKGPPVSLTMPTTLSEYTFDRFPPFFEGLLPEGVMLEGLLKQNKIDQLDYFSQLVAVGGDLVGAVTVKEVAP
jgi:serine/threonine-protein kinase HipA